MALSPQSNEAFLREVDEELRRDQALHIWKTYGRWIIAALLAALLAGGGWIYWQNHHHAQRADEGDQLSQAYQAMVANKNSEADAKLKALADSGTPGFRATAQFNQATLLLQKNDLKGAVALYGAIAGDSKIPQEFRDLALIRQTMVEYDTMKPEAVIARLSPLAVKDNPWFGSAGELVAAANLRLGKRDVAGKLFAAIGKDNSVPQTIRDRTVQMASVLGVDAVSDATSDAAAGADEDKKAQ